MPDQTTTSERGAAYWRLVQDMGPDPCPWVLGDVQGVDNWQFCDGRNAPDPGPDPRLRIVSPGERLDFSQAGYASVPVLSDRAAKVMASHVSVPLLPVTVEGTVPGWSIMVVPWLADALDRAHSNVDYFAKNDRVRPDLAGQIKSAFKLVIDPEKAGGHHLFRLSNGRPYLFFSSALKTAIETAGLKGFRFISAGA